MIEVTYNFLKIVFDKEARKRKIFTQPRSVNEETIKITLKINS